MIIQPMVTWGPWLKKLLEIRIWCSFGARNLIVSASCACGQSSAEAFSKTEDAEIRNALLRKLVKRRLLARSPFKSSMESKKIAVTNHRDGLSIAMFDYRRVLVQLGECRATLDTWKEGLGYKAPSRYAKSLGHHNYTYKNQPKSQGFRSAGPENLTAQIFDRRSRLLHRVREKEGKTRIQILKTKFWKPKKIRPHRRCWGVIFRMALVKGYRFTWGGGIFRPKPPVFDRSWRSPSKNTVKNSTEDTCSWTRPSKISNRKVKKPCVFQLFDLNFLVCNIFFCGSAGGRARRRIFEFLDPFSDWFSLFCDSRNTGFYSVFLFSACLTASFKTSKNLVNYAVLCYGVNENIVNTSVFWRWLKKHCKLQCFWPPDPQKPWYLQWFLLLTAQKHCK